MTGVRSVLGGLRVSLSPFHLARVSPSLRLIQGRGREGRGRVQVYVRKYADVSWSFALPHKSGDTGPSLISPFNLRVGNFVVVCVYICNRECAIESSSSIPSFRSKDHLTIVLCYCRILN